MNVMFDVIVPWEPDASLFASGSHLWRVEDNTWPSAYVVTDDARAPTTSALLVACHDGETWVHCDVENRTLQCAGT